MEIYNNGSAFDFKEHFDKDTEMFQFFSKYMLNKYENFYNKYKKNHKEKEGLFKKDSFPENSYEARCIDIIVNNPLFLRTGRKDILEKIQNNNKKGIFFFDQETFQVIQMMFLFYVSVVNSTINSDENLLLIKKLDDF